MLEKRKILIISGISIILLSIVVITLMVIYFLKKDSNTEVTKDEKENKVLTNYELTEGTNEFTLTDFQSTTSDKPSLHIQNEAEFTLNRGNITKSKDSGSVANINVTGLNSAILASNGGKIDIQNSSISTSGKGSHGIFSTGAKSLISLTNVNITTSAESALGVLVSQNGELDLDKVNVTTTGIKSPALLTESGSEKIFVTGAKLFTSGTESPTVYCKGNLTLDDSEIATSNNESLILEGNNTISLTNSFLSSSNDRKWGILIKAGTSSFSSNKYSNMTMNNGEIEFKSTKGSLISVVNTSTVLDFLNVRISNSSSTFLNATSTDTNGQKGSYGGRVTLNGMSQNIYGNIIADSLSTIDLNLLNSSYFEGIINEEKSAKEINITLDESSSLSLTGDSYITSIKGVTLTQVRIENVFGNGFNLYYKQSDKENEYLKGKTYILEEEGKLIPY